MEGPFGYETKHYGDQCSHCHWHMEGEVIRRPGGIGIPVWCGAGRDDMFMTGRTCETRLPWVELTFYFEDDMNNALTTFEGGDFDFKEEVSQWITHSIPKTQIVADDFDAEGSPLGFRVKFDSVEDFVLFKLFWL